MMKMILLFIIFFSGLSHSMGKWDHYYILCWENKNNGLPPAVTGPFVERDHIEILYLSGNCQILLVEVMDKIGNSVFYKIDDSDFPL